MSRTNLKLLHNHFIDALANDIISHSDVSKRPLEADFRSPLPRRVRVYLYQLKYSSSDEILLIHLRVPGQHAGQLGTFDHSDGRIALLVGYSPEHDVFALWDAGLYPEFGYRRNVRVSPSTVFVAVAGKIGQEQRRVWGQGTHQTVLTAAPRRLADAIQLRRDVTRNRLLGK